MSTATSTPAGARPEGRPEFQRLMADAAERRFDVVLVFHTSRFARNQVEARRYKALLRERLGIRVVSVTQPMGDDPSDPSSFLAESIHEMFDEYYSVSLSFWTRRDCREGTAGSPRWSAPVGVRARCGEWRRRARPGTRAARPRHVRALLNRTGVRSHDRRVAQREGRAHDKGPRVRQGHRARDARQRRVLRLRHRPARPVTRVPRPPRTDRARGAVRPRAGSPLVAHTGPQARPAVPTSTCCASSCSASAAARACMARAAPDRPCAAMSAPPAATATLRRADRKAEPLEAQLVDWLRTFQPDDALRDRSSERSARPPGRRRRRHAAAATSPPSSNASKTCTSWAT